MSVEVPQLELFSFFRLVFLRPQKPGSSGIYIAVRNLALYESPDATGVNLAGGATATASGSYNTTSIPEAAIDASMGSYWESPSFTGGATAWLQLAFPSAIAVRSIRMAGGTSSYPGETPRDFYIAGSNNGTTWKTLVDVADWGGFTDGATPFLVEGDIRLDLFLAGVSVLESGAASTAVYLHNYATGAFVKKLTPGGNGAYEHRPADLTPLLVTHIGPAGYAPHADGPLIPAVR